MTMARVFSEITAERGPSKRVNIFLQNAKRWDKIRMEATKVHSSVETNHMDATQVACAMIGTASERMDFLFCTI